MFNIYYAFSLDQNTALGSEEPNSANVDMEEADVLACPGVVNEEQNSSSTNKEDDEGIEIFGSVDVLVLHVRQH